MVDVAISRARMHDLARLGRSRLPEPGGAGSRKPSASRRRPVTVTFLSSSSGDGPPARPRAASSRPERRDLTTSTITPVVDAVVLSTATNAVIAIVAAGATTLATLLLVGLARQRRAATAGAPVTEVVQDLNIRIEEMGRELTDALERAREETRRSRVLGELAGSIDLEDVLRRTLDAAAAIPGADGAIVTVQGSNGDPVTLAVGLSEQEVHEHSIGHFEPGRRVRSMTMAFAPQEEPEGAPPRVSVGLAVPVLAEG